MLSTLRAAASGGLLTLLLVNCTDRSASSPMAPLSADVAAGARQAALQSGQIRNVQTGRIFTSLQQAFDALPAQFDRSYVLELSGAIAAPAATLRSKNMGGFALTVRGVNGKASLDAQQRESALVFNGTAPARIGNIRLENLIVTNYSATAGNTAGVRFFTVKGHSLLKNVRFTGGYVAMRATSGCDDITLEDVEMLGIRYGGPRFGMAPNDVGHVVFRRLRTTLDQSAANLANSDNVCQLKNFKSLLVEDCTFEWATKTILDIYDMSNVTIRRNRFVQAGRTTTTGSAIQVLPASGSVCRNVVIQNNLFEDCRGSAIYLRGADVKINGNTFIEGGTARPQLALEAITGGLELVNNIYFGTANRNALVNLYQVTATPFTSDYNLYFKPAGSPRNLIQGANGGTNLTSADLTQLRQRGLDRHGLQTTPTFNRGADPRRPTYMLTATSAGRNAGCPQRVASADLLSRSLANTPPDMGCYDYDSF